MTGKPTPRQILDIIDFPQEPSENTEQYIFINKIQRRTDKVKQKQRNKPMKESRYKVGDHVLIKNHQLPSSLEGLAKKFFLLYIGPYRINQVKELKTYELSAIKDTQEILGTYNHNQLRPYNTKTDQTWLIS